MGVTPGEVIEVSCRVFGVSERELLAPSRAHPVVWQRQGAMAAMRHLTNLSYPAIARIFDRDHTTVMNAVKRTKACPNASAALGAILDVFARAGHPDHPGPPRRWHGIAYVPLGG